MSQKIYAVCELLYYMMSLNFLWICYTLAGGFFLGIIPATIAVYECIRKRLLQKDESPAGPLFRKCYRQNRQKNSVVSLVAFVLTGMLLISYLLMKEAVIENILFEFAIRANLWLLFLLLLVFFPVHAYFSLNRFKMLLQPLVFIFICPLQTFASVMIIGVIGSIYFLYPLLGICLGVGLPAYCIGYLFFKKFTKMKGVYF